MYKPLTTGEFIRRSVLVHGTKYDYSKARYEAQGVKVTIICPLHGEFEQYPANHYSKKTNCPKCSTESTISKQRSNTAEFAKKASRVHDGFYSYTNVDYKTAKKSVHITCPIHGDFPQLPTNHLKGVGCPSCNGGMFNPSKPTILYYLNINDGAAYKLGITNKTVAARFTPADSLKLEVVKTWHFDNGRSAYEAEQILIKQFSAYKYQGDDLLCSGNTELFTVDIYEQLELVVKEILVNG